MQTCSLPPAWVGLTGLDLQCFLGAFDIVFDEMILKCFTCYCFASFGRPLWLWSDGPAMEPYFFIIQCFVFLRCLTLGQFLYRRETPALYIYRDYSQNIYVMCRIFSRPWIAGVEFFQAARGPRDSVIVIVIVIILFIPNLRIKQFMPNLGI